MPYQTNASTVGRPADSASWTLPATIALVALGGLVALDIVWRQLAASPLGLGEPIMITLLIFFHAWVLATVVFCLSKGRQLRLRAVVEFQVILLVVVLGTEVALHFINRAVGFIPPWAPPNHKKLIAKASLQYFTDKPWGPQLWTESDNRLRDGLNWHPQLGLTFGDSQGQYVNVVDGLRKTWNPPGRTPATAKTLYTFGGSTTFCWGSRDDYTWPSELSKRLDAAGYDMVVRNGGEVSYGTTQEMVKLLLYLRDGHKIDYVIFYDGGNDVGSYAEGQPGSIQGQAAFQTAINEAKQLIYYLTPTQGAAALVYRGLRQFVEANMYSAVATARVVARFEHRTSAAASAAAGAELTERRGSGGASDVQLEAFADGVLDYYLRNLRVLDALSRAYGFQYVALWQPIFALEDRMFDEEIAGARAHYEYYLDPEFRKLYRLVDRKVTLAAQDGRVPHLYNVSHVLADRTVPYYFDGPHLTEEGNAYLADRIFDLLRGAFALPADTRHAAVTPATRNAARAAPSAEAPPG